MKGKKLVIDLDGTLCSQMPSNEYAYATPKAGVISVVNNFHRAGGKVTIYTARGMTTFEGEIDVIEKRYRPMTEFWLKEAGVEYDQLIFGKPSGDFYVDDKGLDIESFIKKFREKVIFTNGCFDIIHSGHISLLEECRKLSGPTGHVIVGLNSDSSVKRLKGNDRPINDAECRKRVLCALRFVDEVIIFDGDTPLSLIESIRPDIIVKGGDYTLAAARGEIAGQAFAPVHIVSFVDRFSSTKIIDRLT